MFAVGNLPDHVRALGVHQVHSVHFAPAVLVQHPAVPLGMVPDADESVTVCGVALHDGAVDPVEHGLPEFGTHEVLVSLFAGMHLHGDFAGQLDAQQLIHFHNLVRADLTAEIDF